ncbi:cobyric acid synthase [Sunxiuqinia elliptica]|uniref:Cobyric acid synthase n=1 Tax=Sunxiuqinia elliptica TaxID=655355 RepID=A0A4R6GZU0_9BACT|nr:cobyric acid synthase [Sunxiuqinia elliptica]TDO01190.1 adenosylcobyric acid synthase (glutamine-hydrolysing) [Sunxiuqinia elliptica]TDO57701.1 adenosylcobyric acid synthase (glutamine-hydrolysing) [Sunxiuqinia elliptica]
MKNKEKLKPLMFVGTGSDVGKSVINAAFCRIFLQDGYHPAPFKAQNMSLNSYASSEGLELGRAQAVQAEACGIPCLSAMNPILLKPTSQRKAQVVLNGKPIGDQTAREYFLKTDREFLFAEAMKAWKTLDDRYNPIVMEGAGSISEVNLWDKDITNMRVSLETGAPTILIADIDRGGVFGSVYGTIQLLPEAERRLIKGILINKFRGDISLFEEGRKTLEELTGVPVIGVVPYFSDIHIEQEDSVVIDYKRGHVQDGQVNVAVVLLRHMSNFTDFNTLERMPDVNLYYSANPEEIAKADIVLVPGSKNTISDLMYLRKQGLAKAIIQAAEAGKGVYGICGGYQIMGQEIHDPNQVEGEVESIPGLGLLPVITTLTKEKRTVQTAFQFADRDEACSGYEIHMGTTELQDGQPLCRLSDGSSDGCMVSPKLWGTYLHGVLDNKVVVEEIMKACQLEAKAVAFNYNEFKETQYDKLADHIRAHVDMDYLYSVMKED